MNRLILAGALAFAANAVHAQTPTPATPAAKPPTAAAAPAKKKAPARKPAPKPAKVVPPPEPVLEEPSSDQYAAANLTYFGPYECEFNERIAVQPYEIKPGYVEVTWEKQRYVMKPVLSSTGALRLEDVRGRTLVVQIANKSMLMDVEAGKRLLDECLHATQRSFRLLPPSGDSLGIDPAKTPLPETAAAPASASATP